MGRCRNVYEAALSRLEKIFSDFDNIYVSFSGGKDSGVLLNLCIDYIRKHKLKCRLGVFHMDYEVQYSATLAYVEKGSHMHIDASELLAPVGRSAKRTLGAGDAPIGIPQRRLRFLLR